MPEKTCGGFWDTGFSLVERRLAGAKSFCAGCEVDLIECYQQSGKFYAIAVDGAL